VVSTLLNAAYFLPIVYAAYFKPPPEHDHAHGEAPAPILLALALSALLTVGLFLVTDLPLQLARQLTSARG
jgi:multicomponent Na+:H+ antiporter subunit D